MIRAILICMLFIFCMKVNSQSFDVGIMSFLNIVTNNKLYEVEKDGLTLNGGGLKFNFQQAYQQSTCNYNIGLELSFNDWGNQILSRLGANTLLNNQIGINIILLNGLALYVDNLAYVFGAEASVFYLIKIKNIDRVKLNLGLRFTQNTKYKTIGNFSFVDLPISICWLFGNRID